MALFGRLPVGVLVVGEVRGRQVPRLARGGLVGSRAQALQDGGGRLAQGGRDALGALAVLAVGQLDLERDEFGQRVAVDR